MQHLPTDLNVLDKNLLRKHIDFMRRKSYTCDTIVYIRLGLIE